MGKPARLTTDQHDLLVMVKRTPVTIGSFNVGRDFATPLCFVHQTLSEA